MDAFIKSETYENSAYLTTARGEVYRLWFGSEYVPFMERLTPDQINELEFLRRRYEAPRTIEWSARSDPSKWT